MKITDEGIRRTEMLQHREVQTLQQCMYSVACDVVEFEASDLQWTVPQRQDMQ